MRRLCIAACMAGILSSTAVYGTMQVTLAQGSGFSFGNGGEFRATPGGSPSLLSAMNPALYSPSTSGYNGSSYYFQTFCIEHGETFSPGAPYNVSISGNAMNGSQGAGGDPVSIGTAWLYSQFAAGTLVGLTAGNVASPYNYTYGSGRVASAGALQDAIWWLENEPTGVSDPGTGNVFRNAVLAQYGSYAAATADSGGLFGVRALNLGIAGQVQDQLVIVPEPTTIIAGALLLLPFGASAMRILRKNRAA
jgi:hypothetical protein